MPDLYNTHYGKFAMDAQAAVRKETYGEDLGQSSWMTADELRGFAELLEIEAGSSVLEVGSGSGGSALSLAELTGCTITGVDVNEFGIANATELAKQRGLSDRANFLQVDASKRLPFEDETFNAVFSNDVLCHIPNRQNVLGEWHRVLKPGGRILFTDALVISGIVSHEEIANRSSIGLYFFLPPGENERMIQVAGFTLLEVRDLTSAAAEVSKRWHDARNKHRDAMISIEGEDNFEGLQKFLWGVHTLTAEGRVSRYLYLAERSPK
jgi:SAM-dependent methyltransferase